MARFTRTGHEIGDNHSERRRQFVANQIDAARRAREAVPGPLMREQDDLDDMATARRVKKTYGNVGPGADPRRQMGDYAD